MDLNRLTDLELLTLTLYGEARGESLEGQVAVGCVIRNRVSPNKSVKEVCLEPHQFSCWNELDPNYAILTELGQKMLFASVLSLRDKALSQCEWVAQGIMKGVIIDITHGARNYMTTVLLNSDKAPAWSKTLPNHIIIGNHTFLNA